MKFDVTLIDSMEDLDLVYSLCGIILCGFERKPK